MIFQFRVSRKRFFVRCCLKGVNLYLNYFEMEMNVENDNPPIGIILAAEKDDIFVEYAIKGITNKIFVSKYQLYLPEKEELQERIKKIVDNEN